MSTDISNSEDALDVREIIERVEELEKEREELSDALESAEEAASEANNEDTGVEEARAALATWDSDNGEELKELSDLLDELKGNGGDHQWRGDWYPVTLIRDSYFKDYAQDLAEDIGAISRNATWPLGCIDWDRAADELKMDYTTVDFGRVTYWYR